MSTDRESSPHAATCVVWLLGPMRISNGTDQVPVPARMDRAVLAHLALAQGRWLSVDALMEAAWGEHSPRGARNALQVKISRLRRLLGTHADALEFAQGAYRLRLAQEQVDVGLFERYVAEARACVDAGAVEDARRTMLMRTHSGLHVLCGVVFRDFGALVTGGNMEPGEARMDFNLPEVPPDFKARIEELVNAEVAADRSVAVRVLPRAEALALPDIIRTQSNLIPPEEQEVRIVDIVGLDVQADGGTHVASTAQIGKVQVVKVESKGRANRRVRVRLAD